MFILNFILSIINILIVLWLIAGVTFNLFYCFYMWFELKKSIQFSNVIIIMLWPLYYIDKQYKTELDNIIKELKKK